jgi:tRNA(His) guanylyltransferase
VNVDTLGDRMKIFESMTEARLMPYLPALVRIDGRSFHTFTRGLSRPYCEKLSNLMVETTKFLVSGFDATLGYTQSDEISLMFYQKDFKSQLPFDGRLLKLCSVLSSATTEFFVKNVETYLGKEYAVKPINFDCRVWNVPTEREAVHYFVWRERDAVRNSVQMAAQSVYSHGELQDKNSSELQEMLFQKGINFNNFPVFFRRGTYVQRLTTNRPFTPEELDKLPPLHDARKNPNMCVERSLVTELVDVPILSSLTNATDFIFGRAKPLTISE